MHSVTGSPAFGPAIVDQASAYEVLHFKNEVSISATTTLVNSDGVDGASAGDTIEYVITLTNTGTTTLRNSTVSDEILDEQLRR